MLFRAAPIPRRSCWTLLGTSRWSFRPLGRRCRTSSSACVPHSTGTPVRTLFTICPLLPWWARARQRCQTLSPSFLAPPVLCVGTLCTVRISAGKPSACSTVVLPSSKHIILPFCSKWAFLCLMSWRLHCQVWEHRTLVLSGSLVAVPCRSRSFYRRTPRFIAALVRPYSLAVRLRSTSCDL